MSVREYIGARYVPVFADPFEWDSTKTYEPLTIVQYQGNSYTSRQYVPAGIEITNANYWAETGNYNAQIEAYRQEVLTFDGRITANANDIHNLTQSIKTNAIGAFVAPQYVGDFMSNEQFASVLNIGNLFYCFSTQNLNGRGTVRVFSSATNSLVQQANNVLMGHANSVCFNENDSCIYIAPMFEYTSNDGSHVDTVKIYRYSQQLALLEEIEMPQRIYAVSFDSVTKTMYAFAVISSMGGTVTVYKKGASDQNFSVFKTFDFPFVFTDNVWFQDAAVHDGIVVFCDTQGTAYSADLSGKNVEWLNSFKIGAHDYGGMWVYNETEGLEFNEFGNLYQARTCPVGLTEYDEGYSQTFGFVTELNWGIQSYSTQMYELAQYNTLYLRPDTQAKFTLGRADIRALSQMTKRLAPFSTIEISGNVTDHEARILSRFGTVNLNIVSGATLTLPVFRTVNCPFNIYIDEGATLRVTSTNYKQAINIASQTQFDMRVRNRGTLEYAQPRFIHEGYGKGIIVYHGNGNQSIVINEQTFTENLAVFVGSNKIFPIETSGN